MCPIGFETLSSWKNLLNLSKFHSICYHPTSWCRRIRRGRFNFPFMPSPWVSGYCNSFDCVFREKLVANDFVQVHKIIEHITEKIFATDCSSNMCPGTAAGVEKINPMLQENLSSRMESIEILCNDQVILTNETPSARHVKWGSFGFQISRFSNPAWNWERSNILFGNPPWIWRWILGLLRITRYLRKRVEAGNFPPFQN